MRDQYILLEFSKVHEKLDGYVFSLVFFDVTAPSLLFGERFSLVFFDVTAVIIQHSSLIIRHSSFVIHHSYINQQSIKNRSKINQKSSQNHPKSNQNQSWRRLGGVLGASWGGFSIYFRKYYQKLDRFWGLGDPLGSLLAPKTDPKARNSGHFFDFVTNIKLKRFFIAFGFHFGGYRSLKS